MKLRLPLLLRLALLSTAAAYTLGSGCLFADDAPADATAQDDPIAEAVEDDDAALMPTIGFEGYTESQLVDIQSSDAVGAVIHGVLENSTTGAVANVGTTTSSSNGATPVAESPALTLSAPAEPATDSALTTSTLSDSAGEGAVAPFFSAEEAAALVVASPATSTPLIKNTSTATLSSSDASDETTSSAVAAGASSSIASVGTASAGGAGASSGGGSASYSLTSSSSDSSSSSLVTPTPTDDTSSDPIAEEVLEDSTTEGITTTSTTLPDSSASTLATTSSTSSATTRALPQMKLLGSTESSTPGTVTVDGTSLSSDGGKSNGVEFRWGMMGSGDNVNILYLHTTSTYPGEVEVAADSFFISPADKETPFKMKSLKSVSEAATLKIESNGWDGGKSTDLKITTLSVNSSASLEINQKGQGSISATISKVVDSNDTSKTPILTSVKNSGTLTLGTDASEEGESKVTASSVFSIGTLKNTGTMTLNGTTTITGALSNSGKLTNEGVLTFSGEGASYTGVSMNGKGETVFSAGSTIYLDSLTHTDNCGELVTKNSTGQTSLTYIYTVTSGDLTINEGVKYRLEEKNVSGVVSDSTISVTDSCYFVSSSDTVQLSTIEAGGLDAIFASGTLNVDVAMTSAVDLFLTGKVDCSKAASFSRINFYSTESSALTVSGDSGALTHGNATYKALSDSVSATLSRSAAGDFSLGDSTCSVKDASISLSKSAEIVRACLNNVSISTKENVRLGYNGSDGNSLNSLTAKNVDVGYWKPGDSSSYVHAVLNGEGTITGDLQVIMTSDLTIRGSLKVGGDVVVGAATNEISKIYVNDGSGNVVDVQSKNGTSEARITGGVTMKYDSADNKAVIAGDGNGSVATISNAVIDVKENSKLELSNVVLAESTWLHDEETTGDGGSTSTYTGSVDLNGVEGKVTGTGKDGGTLQTGTVLTQTGTTGSVEGTKLTLQSDAKVFKIAYTQITKMASIGGTGLTLDFDKYDGGKGFASLYETLNGKYDYVAIEFDSTVGEIDFSTLVVNAKITNGFGVTGSTTGYYVGGTNGVVNSNGTSGVVVYFDAMALPEPTTSTLGLLALAALCARRRRSRTRMHAE